MSDNKTPCPKDLAACTLSRAQRWVKDLDSGWAPITKICIFFQWQANNVHLSVPVARIKSKTIVIN